MIKNPTVKTHLKDNLGMIISLAVFAALLLWNLPYLSNPPYWDDILGLHNQAIWLAKHNFNLAELWQPGQAFWEGGSNVYRFGLLPYFYGLFYLLLPSSYVHVFGHVFNIVCLAGTFGLFFAIIRKYSADWVALLWCVAAICEPVMAGRTAALGQECPLILLTALAIYFVFRQKYRLTLLFLAIAILIKMTAVIPALALTVWLAAWKLLPNNWFKSLSPPRRIGGLVAVSALLALGSATLLALFEVDYKFGEWSLSLTQKIFGQIPLLTPVQGLALIALIATAVWRLTGILSRREKITFREWFALFLLIVIGGFWAAFLLYSVMLPRYTATIVFPMFAALAIIIPSQRVAMAIAVIFIVIGICNHHGRFYRSLPGAHRRSGEYLERSREYLRDIELNQQACRTLEKRGGGLPLAAKWPFVQMLTMPEMGYVEKPLRVYDAGNVLAKYTGAEPLPEKSKIPPATLYFFVSNSFEFWPLYGPPLMPEKGDRIFHAEKGLGGFLVIYQKRGRK